jgi:orotate phosphoribosyltransferase
MYYRMSEEEAWQSFNASGGIIENGHFVFDSGNHGSVYINKYAVYRFTETISRLCKAIAGHFANKLRLEIDTVAAPAKGGIILSQWVAYWLTVINGTIVKAVFAEETENGIFAFKWGYDQNIIGQKILFTEDLLTTGRSIRKVIETAEILGGRTLGLGALWNRGGVTEEDVGNVPELFSLINRQLDTWPESKCPLCKNRVPVNTQFGKGKEFLSR